MIPYPCKSPLFGIDKSGFDEDLFGDLDKGIVARWAVTDLGIFFSRGRMGAREWTDVACCCTHCDWQMKDVP